MSDGGERGRNLYGMAMCIAVILLCVTVYTGAYFALSDPTIAPMLNAPPGDLTKVRIQMFRYGGGTAEVIFWPLTQIDRLVRPSFWAADDFNVDTVALLLRT